MREASNSENSKNVGIKNINSSGIKGVSYDKANNKWLSQIRIHGKKVNLGRFKPPQEASEVYEAYAKQHHGEFYYKAAA